jgi:hypothetical protein
MFFRIRPALISLRSGKAIKNYLNIIGEKSSNFSPDSEVFKIWSRSSTVTELNGKDKTTEGSLNVFSWAHGVGLHLGYASLGFHSRCKTHWKAFCAGNLDAGDSA